MTFTSAVKQLKDSKAARTIRMRGYVSRSDYSAETNRELFDRYPGAVSIFDLVFKTRDNTVYKYLAYTTSTYGDMVFPDTSSDSSYAPVTPLDPQLLCEMLRDDWEVKSAADFDLANEDTGSRW